MLRAVPLLAVVVAAVFHVSPVLAAETISAAAIDATVARTMKTFKVPGIAVAVVKDDKVVYSKGQGVASLESVTRDAPMAGGRLFDARAVVTVPRDVDLALVQTAVGHATG